MPPSIDATFGMWMVALFLETILYGCSLLQIWLYFYWYPLDHWILKAMVTLLAYVLSKPTHLSAIENQSLYSISETLQTVFLFISTYNMLISHFGDFDNLLVVNWMDTAQLICLYISAMIVQLTILNNFSKLDKTAPSSVLQGAASLSCDIVITSSLLFTLNDRKTEAEKWNSKHGTSNLLNSLMVIAINRGVATAIFSALNIILFLSMPHTFFFFLGLMPSSKLYMNSALGTLNCREYLRSKSELQNWKAMSLQFQDPVIFESRAGDVRLSPMDNPIRIHMHTETYSEHHAEEPAKTDSTV
ncbi:hypothetical protein CVT26_004149 [Gymnopilus dilepis]|uniref:DUF6534 domain-containing protein n=1 Tax=Gymnopilus dilepis TaxID=231916 RepID=A0A409W703_9AGAR|nr:hypothetical protein CVT26_004149 [Gymnopilus dilepis]